MKQFLKPLCLMLLATIIVANPAFAVNSLSGAPIDDPQSVAIFSSKSASTMPSLRTNTAINQPGFAGPIRNNAILNIQPTNTAGFTPVQAAISNFGATTNNIANTANTAAGAVNGLTTAASSMTQGFASLASAAHAQGYREGAQSSALARMQSGSGGGLLGGLGSIGGIASGGLGGLGGLANAAPGGLSGGFASLTSGLGQLSGTLRAVEGLTGANLGGRTLGNIAGYTNVISGITNPANGQALINNVRGSVNQLGAGFTASGNQILAGVNGIGSSLSRRTPTTAAVAPAPAVVTAAATPAPSQGFVGPPGP